jgi:hypothetical protein
MTTIRTYLCETGYVHVILLPVVREDQVLERDFDFDPLLVRQRWPNVMRFRNDAGIGAQDHLYFVHIYVQASQDQDQSRECCIRRNTLEPIVIDVEEDHLRLSRSQDQIAKFLNLECRLEWELELGALEYDIGKVKTVYLEGIKHSFPCDNDLLRLLFDRQRPDERRHFFGCFPFGELRQTLLTGPYACVNNL